MAHDRRYLLGCDLAKSLDYTSFAVIEMVSEPKQDYLYHLIGLDRVRGVDYPQITEIIIKSIQRLELEGRGTTVDGPHLCMDASGLGAPIKDYIKQNKTSGSRSKLYPVVFTGGEKARYDKDTSNYNISKTLVICNFLSLMQHHRFDYAPDLPALPLLQQEIASFKRHTTSSGKTGFDAESGSHDDLICAICIPLIIGEWRYKHSNPPICAPSGATSPSRWNFMESPFAAGRF
jgi:hypothetical protein